MKFFVLLFAVISVAYAGVIENTIGSDNADVEANYKQGLKDIQKFLRVNVHPKAEYYFGIVERSINVSCAAEKVKKYGLDEKLAELIGNEAEFTDKQKKEFTYIIFKPLQLCSTISRPISDTIFDVVMSFGHLVRAFKDEPELAEYMTFVKCANNYAVKNKLIDPKVYALDYKFIDPMEKFACEEMKKEFLEGYDEACWKESAADTVNFAIRTVLLTQVKLTSQQHQTVSDYFFNEMNRISEKTGVCEFEQLTYHSTESDDIISKLGPLKGLALELGNNA